MPNRYQIVIDHLDEEAPSFGHQMVEAASPQEACELAVIGPITAQDPQAMTGLRVLVMACREGNTNDWAEMVRTAPVM